jgi:predicted nucleotidyltransferase
MAIRTLAERKADTVAAQVAAVAELRRSLSGRARELGGRFLIYGSAARGEFRHDSDVDLLVDFPDQERTSAAFDFAEEACSRLRLRCDIRPLAMCDERFLTHVLPEAIPLP